MASCKSLRTLAASAKSPSGRYLSFSEREEIALLLAQDGCVREIARRLGRAASTISRELRRNAATRSGGLEYRARTAQWHAERAVRRPKLAKLVTNPVLQRYVQDRLAGLAGHGCGDRAKNGPALAGHGAEAVRDAIMGTIITLPEQLRRSLTWDQGAEMAQHARLRIDTGLPV